jgi:uncharacterized protein (DUF433 family)
VEQEKSKALDGGFWRRITVFKRHWRLNNKLLGWRSVSEIGGAKMIKWKAKRCDMQTQELIISSPDILGGTPVFIGTRVPVKNLTDYIEAGNTLNEFLDDFPSVSREQAVGFIEQAKEALLAQLA